MVERKLCVAVAQLSQVGRMCEIGFNGGHSALIWPLANSQARVIMFVAGIVILFLKRVGPTRSRS